MSKISYNVLMKSKTSLLIIPLAICLLAVACSTGSYPVDVFTEMHYQQSYKSQEPPRLKTSQDSVPFTIDTQPLRRAEPNSLDEALTTINPISRTSETERQGKEIFIINCAMCHGQSGHGDGTVLTTMIEKYGYQPKLSPDLRVASALPDSFLFTMISNEDLIVGDGAMPLFQKLLTPEERWSLVNYIKSGLPD